MSYEYSEDGSIEQATQDVLEDSGWQVVTASRNEYFVKIMLDVTCAPYSLMHIFENFLLFD